MKTDFGTILQVNRYSIDVPKNGEVGTAKNTVRSKQKQEFMMKYKITSHENGIDIDVAEITTRKEKMVQAFQECQEGRCSCPTEEYEKIETLSIDTTEETIRLAIKSKKGEEIDTKEIEKCLEYTKSQVAGD